MHKYIREMNHGPMVFSACKVCGVWTADRKDVVESEHYKVDCITHGPMERVGAADVVDGKLVVTSARHART